MSGWSRSVAVRRLPVIAGVLLLAACQSGGPLRPDATLFRELADGEFTLYQELTIAPGRVRIILQNGSAAYGASEYQPRCELEVTRILDTPQTIPAGSYRIGKVRGMTRYVGRPPAGAKLAAATPFGLVYDGSDGWYMYTYRMQLHGGPYSEPLLLICGGAYNYPAYVRYPTLAEMNSALGNFGILTLR